MTSRLGVLPYQANPIQKSQFILNPQDPDGFVQWCISNRQNAIDSFSFEKGRFQELAGLGAYARTIPNEILVKIMGDEKQRKDFLEVCHAYDSNPYVCGMGKDNLFAKGEL